MGWSTKYAHGCDFTFSTIGDLLNGLSKYNMGSTGYEYIILDDCWQAPQRNQTGHLACDKVADMEVLSKLWLHDSGHKLGLYSSAGTHSCLGLPGSLGHEKIDAETFAAWGVGYVKYANCYGQGIAAVDRYTAMATALNETNCHALNQTNCPMYFAIDNWGNE